MGLGETSKAFCVDLPLSRRARSEIEAMGLDRPTDRDEEGASVARAAGRARVPRRAISAPEVLSEAFHYVKPVSFSRGLRIALPGATLLLLSGTASVDENGATAHPGDFPAQCLRTYRNLTRLLASEAANWHDVVRTTCYLRDIERDYEAFNEIRTAFLKTLAVDPLPASTAIEARLCRADLLIEIEAMAVIPSDGEKRR